MGKASVDTMLEEMSIDDLLGWKEYSNIEPFGYPVNAYWFGYIPAAIYNSIRTKDSDKIFTPDEFYPKLNKQVDKQPWQEQYDIASRLTMASK